MVIKQVEIKWEKRLSEEHKYSETIKVILEAVERKTDLKIKP